MSNKKSVLLCVLVFILSISFIGFRQDHATLRDRRQRVKRQRQIPRDEQAASKEKESIPTHEKSIPSLDYDNKGKPLIGFMGVPRSEFSKAKDLGASVVLIKGSLSSSELQSDLATAKSQGLGLLIKAEGRDKFQDISGEGYQDGQKGMSKSERQKIAARGSSSSVYKIDFNKLENMVKETFANNGVASDPDFLGYYIIDEPCHQKKWDITTDDFKKLYLTVKKSDPDVAVLVNFGHLSCLEGFVENLTPEDKIVDIATFTITTAKLKKYSDYIAEEAERAKRIKQTHPDIQVVPIIAVYEHTDRNIPIPSADWVRKTGTEILKYDSFDGIMFYSWYPSSYMGDTIADVVDDSKYSSAFKDVLKAANEKVHNF